jgi:hypothetical protein
MPLKKSPEVGISSTNSPTESNNQIADIPVCASTSITHLKNGFWHALSFLRCVLNTISACSEKTPNTITPYRAKTRSQVIYFRKTASFHPVALSW